VDIILIGFHSLTFLFLFSSILLGCHHHFIICVGNDYVKVNVKVFRYKPEVALGVPGL
jgi:hypothetical protein